MCHLTRTSWSSRLVSRMRRNWVIAVALTLACGGGESTSSVANQSPGAGGTEHEVATAGAAGSVTSSAGQGGMGTGGGSQPVDSGTDALIRDATMDGALGMCEIDTDCVIREGCPTCGVCQARTDPPPMASFMCELCAPVNTSCLCLGHHCGPGPTANATSCTTNESCGAGQLCVSYITTSAAIHTDKACRDNPCGQSTLSCSCAFTLCVGFGAGLCTVADGDLSCANGGK